MAQKNIPPASCWFLAQHILKIKTVCSCETLIDFHWAVRSYSLVDRNHYYRCSFFYIIKQVDVVASLQVRISAMLPTILTVIFMDFAQFLEVNANEISPDCLSPYLLTSHNLWLLHCAHI